MSRHADEDDCIRRSSVPQKSFEIYFLQNSCTQCEIGIRNSCDSIKVLRPLAWTNLMFYAYSVIDKLIASFNVK